MLTLRRFAAVVLAAALLSVAFAAPAWTQQLIVYPQKGQSPQQQQQDRFECHQWAVQQTGFDPTMGASAAPAPTTGTVTGAARGAALGAVGGAIAGNAGRGAAIGAGTGAVFGTMRRNSQVREAQQGANSQQAAYNRALSACLTGRGYSVQ
jgi:hypothetical protein